MSCIDFIGQIFLLLCPTLCDPVDFSSLGSSIGFSGQEYWSGLPGPPPGDLPDPGIEPKSPASPALQIHSLLAEPLGKAHTRQ